MDDQGYIEAVPNFSEGRNREAINSIARVMASTLKVQLLNVDSNESANRTVFTLVGPTNAVLEAVRRGIIEAANSIDMTSQSGTHPRIGAADVVPFIPLQGITMDKLNEKVLLLAENLGDELDLPIYMYEYSALREGNRNLADVRKGEYEGLKDKLKEERGRPDFGPTSFNPKLGATVMGVRDFLIAYNINIDTKDSKIAGLIAKEMRSSHAFQYDKRGKRSDKKEIVPYLKAISWFIEEFDTYQISTNLTNFRVTGMHTAFELCKVICNKHSVKVTGSELIGLVPKKAILDAGRFYGKGNEVELIEYAVQRLNLTEVDEFNPESRILDYVSGISVS